MVTEEELKKLISIASQPLKNPKKHEKKQSISSVSNVFDYLIRNEIKAHSTFAVRGVVIYCHYNDWCNAENIKPDDYKKFCHALSKKFEKVTKKYGVTFLVDPTKFDLSPEGLERADKFIKGLRKNGKKTKKED